MATMNFSSGSRASEEPSKSPSIHAASPSIPMASSSDHSWGSSSSSPKSSSRLPVEYLCTAILKVGETEEEAVEVKRWETWWRFSELRAWGMEAQEHIRAGTVFPPDAAGRDVMTGHKNKNKELRFPSRSPLRSFFRGNESDQEKFILRRRRKLNDFVGAVWGGGVWAEGVEAFFGVDNSSFRRRTF